MATFRATRLLSSSLSSFSQLLNPATTTPSSHHPLLLLLRISSCHCFCPGHRGHRGLTTTPLLQKKTPQYPPRPPPPPDADIEESFLKGSGPGGQKINKTNSAVQLKHLPTGIVIKCQATRSRSQNRKIARQLLADRLDDLTRGDQSRSAVVGNDKRKKRASSAKKSRRKYRKLDEERLGAVDEGEEGEGEGDEEGLGEQDAIGRISEEIEDVTAHGDSTKGEHIQPDSTRVHHETPETGKI